MLTPILKERMLRAELTGKPLYLGLGSKIDGGDLHECGDPAYARQPVVFGDPYEDGDLVSVDNLDDVLFASWARDSEVEMGVFFVVTSLDDGGQILAAGPLERIVTPLRGDTLRFWPGDLTISLSGSEE